MLWWLGIWDCQQHKLPVIWTLGTRRIHTYNKDIFLKTGPSGNLKLQGAFKWIILAQSSINAILPMKSTNFFNVLVSMESTPRFTSPSCPDLSLVLTGSPDYPLPFHPSLPMLRELSALPECCTEMFQAAACALPGGFLPALCILIPARWCFSQMLPSAQTSPLELPHSLA